jgi:hypothetical protein
VESTLAQKTREIGHPPTTNVWHRQKFPENRALAAQMFRAPVENFAAVSWPKAQAAELRKLLIHIMERHQGRSWSRLE